VLVQDHNGSFVVRSAHRGHLESAEDLTLKSGAKLVVEVAKDASLTTDGALAVSAAGDITFKTDRGAVTVEGLSGLTLKCGGSKIELTPGGVTVSGPMISLG
jgi:type VI secretion system secreted protein VgrG